MQQDGSFGLERSVWGLLPRALVRWMVPRMRLDKRDLQALACVCRGFCALVEDNPDLRACKNLPRWMAARGVRSVHAFDAVPLGAAALKHGVGASSLLNPAEPVRQVVLHCLFQGDRPLPEYTCLGVLVGPRYSEPPSRPSALPCVMLLLLLRCPFHPRVAAEAAASIQRPALHVRHSLLCVCWQC